MQGLRALTATRTCPHPLRGQAALGTPGPPPSSKAPSRGRDLPLLGTCYPRPTWVKLTTEEETPAGWRDLLELGSYVVGWGLENI